jgi:hypothetical protein
VILTAPLLAGILLAHFIGDYFLQTHWMATEKTSRIWPAIVHGITYTLPYAFITHNPLALFTIAATHIVIDRWRLPKHLIWLKNQFAPKAFRPGHTATGYPTEIPVWLATALLIVVDNTAHLVINTVSILWLK